MAALAAATSVVALAGLAPPVASLATEALAVQVLEAQNAMLVA